jgi:hypothetical protein
MMSARTKMRFHTLATREKDRHRARALGRGRLCLRGQPPVGLEGCFSGREILESNDCLLLILSDNYNRTTNDPTTEAQSARRTHRDDSLTKVRDFLQTSNSLSSILGGPSILSSNPMVDAFPSFPLPGI